MLVRIVVYGTVDAEFYIIVELLEDEMEVVQAGQGVESANTDGATYSNPKSAPEEYQIEALLLR